MDRKIGNLSSRDLKKIMQLFVEITNGKFHEFSLIAIKNSDGKYLQKFDERWTCWLFPYTRSTENNKENVDHYVSGLLKTPIITRYVTNAKHCKYSVSDDAYKIYDHKLYEVLLSSVPDNMTANEFCIDGIRYKWMSVAELEKNEDVMKKNEDIIAFVKTKCL